MDVHLQSTQNSSDPTSSYDLLERNDLSQFDSFNAKELSGRETCNSEKDFLPNDKEVSDAENINLITDDSSKCKSLNVREIHETSPFKQAVKGFVLNKLSKKVGSSHLLSGITEKIVKKLEDGKDTIQIGHVHISESDLNLSNLKVKESSEVISSSVSCELKSVVANDIALSESINIEDAVECFEEPKSSISDISTNFLKTVVELRSSSVSLPSSPAHRFTQRASSISCSFESSMLDNVLNFDESTELCDDTKEEDESSISSKPDDKTELQVINENKKICNNPGIVYPNNAYFSEYRENKNLRDIAWEKVSRLVLSLKNVFSSLSTADLLLLVSIIIHNCDICSPYLSYIFDGIAIAYVIYSHIFVMSQRPLPIRARRFPFINTQLEKASVEVDRSTKTVKASVKVLSGEYDPEMVKIQPTDLVDIIVEDCCLKFFSTKKKNTKDFVKSETISSFDLEGATVSIVPKGLSKRSVWKKKYPICITFPLSPEHVSTPDSCTEIDPSTSDDLSAFPPEDQQENIPKAVYIFSLTDREKETLYWALYNSAKSRDNTKCSEKMCDSSLKLDFSSLTYTALLELNTDDTSSIPEDACDDENSILVNNPDAPLNFEKYMSMLYENYERMNKFISRSRSFEDLSYSKDESSRPVDAFISKDDSYLSKFAKHYSVDWLNLAIGRVLYDFLTQKRWSDYVKRKIQRKLDKIEMPTFVESLEVSDVFLGSSVPQIHTVTNPVIDDNGVWFNFDFNYCGSFQMTLKTKLNMIKAKNVPQSGTAESSDMKQNLSGLSDEDSEEEGSESSKTSSSTKKKNFLNRIEKVIYHRHFQTVAQSRFVKRYVGDLSNMPLTLTVELNTLHGTLTLNIPPAPTDRIWYGFRKDPVLSLNAYPKVGTREINLSAVVQMIERKLIQEFKKAVVMPNMDDLLVPFMYTPIYDR